MKWGYSPSATAAGLFAVKSLVPQIHTHTHTHTHTRTHARTHARKLLRVVPEKGNLIKKNAEI